MKKTYYLITVLLAFAIKATTYALTPEEMLLLKRAGVPDEQILELHKKENPALPHQVAQINPFDWNEDGKKDVITGSNSGRVYAYINSGTGQQPLFAEPTEIRGTEVRGSSSPYIVDWNNDGKKDVIIGTRFGEVIVFINKGDNKQPIFPEGIRLNNGALDVGSYSSPSMVDWNADGKKDLVVGNEDGQVYVYHNIGEDHSPIFASDGMVTGISVPRHSTPEIVDWNNDGLFDIICGSSNGKAYIFINEGRGGSPKFGKPQILRVNNRELQLLSRTSIIVLDWDDDGKKDILISNRYDKYVDSLGEEKIEMGIYLLMNVGTKEKPEFKELKRIKGAFRNDTLL